MDQKVIKIFAILPIVIVLAVSTAPVYALTGNFYPDSTHSFVGLVVFYELDAIGNKIPVSVCSGVLLSPTIMITTAHGCLSQNAIVCFDQGPMVFIVGSNVSQ